MTNLEPICAEYGHKMIISGNDPKLTDQENVITRSLGVMAENGLYAMCVFLLSCNKKEYGKIILTQHIWGLWTKIGIVNKTTNPLPEYVLAQVRSITNDLPKLILARKVTEQTLIFARYHAKADITA
jgi:hypothetical protein